MKIIDEISEVIQYREMIYSMVHKELRGKYKGSFLGFLWSLLIPLFQLVIYSLVFSVFMKSGIDNYGMFLFVALIPWIFFNNCVSLGALSVINQKNLVSKIYFPRVILPISTATSYFINMLLCFIVVFIALFATGIGVTFGILYFLPIIMLIEYILGIGASLLFSAITVYIRDMEHVLGIVTMAWMYLTPVLYSIDIVPEKYQKIIYINPMTPVILAYRDILYYGVMPNSTNLLYALGWAIGLLVIGWSVFRYLQKGFVEEL